MKLPRSLEADETAAAVRRVLASRTAKLWAGGVLAVPQVVMNAALEETLRRARLRRQICLGLEAIDENLRQEKRGIAQVRSRQAAPYGERISRLLFFTQGGAERFYRHGEALLLDHAPRLLGCLLDIDGRALGRMMTGRDVQIKLVMVEHKDSVSDVLRAIITG